MEFEIEATILFRVSSVPSADAALQILRELANNEGLPAPVGIVRVLRVGDATWNPRLMTENGIVQGSREAV